MFFTQEPILHYPNLLDGSRVFREERRFCVDLLTHTFDNGPEDGRSDKIQNEDPRKRIGGQVSQVYDIIKTDLVGREKIERPFKDGLEVLSRGYGGRDTSEGSRVGSVSK